MNFKSKKVADDLYSQSVWSSLREILSDADGYSQTNLGRDIFVTSILRSYAEDLALHGSGIHCTGRAADLRIGSWTDPYGVKLSHYINARYVYDSSRPQLKVAFMAPHGDGPHVHVQVHARTKSRG